MKSFVVSLVLLLAIGIAGSAPASAAVSDDARETARSRSLSNLPGLRLTSATPAGSPLIDQRCGRRRLGLPHRRRLFL